MKEIKLKVSLDGKQAVAVVDELGDGLRDLDVRNAREAAETIESIGRGGTLKQTVKDAQALKTILDNVDDDQLKEATEASKQLGDESKKAADTYRDASGRMRDANGKFVKSAGDAKKAVGDLGSEAEKTAKQFDKLKSTGAAFENFGNKVQGVGEALTVGITAPVVTASYAILKAGTDYESAMNMFGAVTNATASEMEAAAAKARELGSDVELPATSAKDAALAMTELAKGGLLAKDAMDAAKGTLQLAAAGQMDGAQAAEIQANALNTFSLKASEATRVADLLAAAANASSAGVKDIAESLAQSGASFAAAKVGIEDVTTSIAIMANAGIKGSDAGTSLKTFLSSIQAPSSGAADAMKELGVKVFDAQGKFKGMPAVIDDFSKALSGLTDEKQAQLIQEIFGSDASRAAQILFKNGVDGFNKTKEAVTEVGAAAKLSASLTKGLGGAWEAFGSQIETIAIDIFNNVKAPLTDILNTGVQVVGQLGDAFSQLAPSTQTTVLAMTAIAAVIPPVLVVLGILITYIAPLLSGLASFATAAATAGSATALLSTGFATVGTFITATLLPALSAIAPIVLTVVAVIGVLAAAGAALYLAWETNFGNIQGTVAVFQSQISEAFNGLMTIVKPAIDAVSGYVAEGVKKISQWWAENGADINRAAETIFTTLLTTVQSALEAIKDFWSRNGEWITEYAKTTWEAVKGIIEGVMLIISGIIKTVAGVINGDWSKVWSGLGQIAGGALQAVVSIIGAGVILILANIRGIGEGLGALVIWFLEQAAKIGNAIIEGMRNGIVSGAGAIVTAAWDLGKRAINSLKEAVDSHSPSREAHKVGVSVGEGKANGIRASIPKVKAAAKALGDETIKALRDAVKEFDKTASMSPEQVNRRNQTAEYSQAKSDLEEIIKLRGQTGAYQDQPLPQTFVGIAGELKRHKEILQETESAQKSFNKTLENLTQIDDDIRKSIQQSNEEFKKRKKAIEDSGAADVLSLSKEIELLGVTDEVEKQRIENAYKLKELRAEMSNDGYGESQIKEAEDLLRIENARRLELAKLKADKQAQIDAAKELADAQKKAAEDAAKAMRETWENTRDFVRESLDIMTDDTLSFGERVKSFFGNINDRLKESFLDKISASITTQLLGYDPRENTVIGAVNKSNDYLKRIADAIAPTSALSTISSGGIFGGRSSAGGGLLGTIGGIIGGIGGGNLGNRQGINSPLIMNYSNGILDESVAEQYLNFSENSGSGSLWSSVKNLFSTKDGGLFAARNNILTGKTSKLGGIMGGIGDIASFVAPMLGGGRLSSVVGMAGQGASIGSMFGPWGAAAGAAIGGLVGLFSNPQRKNDEITRTEYKNTALSALDQLISQLGNKPSSIQPPSEARAQADSILNQYRAAVSTLKDKKTRNIALNELSYNESLGYKSRAIDTAIQNAVKWQEEDAVRQKVASEFTGQFASGVYADFNRYNGLLPGTWSGRDYIKALLADEELVLNRNQRLDIIAAAGYDVFSGHGIPNYPNTPQPEPPKFSTGMSFASSSATSSSNSSRTSAPPVVIENLDIRIDALTGKIKAVAASSDMQRLNIANVKVYFEEGQLPE